MPGDKKKDTKLIFMFISIILMFLNVYGFIFLLMIMVAPSIITLQLENKKKSIIYVQFS